MDAMESMDTTKKSVKIKYFSMFSGIGGFELGIENALGKENCNCVGYSEIKEEAIIIYKKHFPGHKNYGDCTRIIPEELQEFNLFVGGFPCQTFSNAGSKLGFKDTRGTLFFEAARIISIKKPKLCIFENVEGLLSHDNGRTLKIIFKTLQNMGYVGEMQLLNSRYFGVPQNRPRIYIIGHLGKPKKFCFPIRYMERENANKEISINSRRDIHSILNIEMPCSVRRNILYCYAIRKLTPIEYERIQGFPDNWTEGIQARKRYDVIGNSVTPNVVETIIRKLYEF